MNKIATLLFFLSTATLLYAQDTQNEIKDFHLGIIYPLSTNGLDAHKYQNKLSLHLLGGISAGELGLCVSGFGHVTSGNLDGMQLSGFGNVISGNANGIVMGGFGNVLSGRSSGIIVAGFGNVAQKMEGIQVSGFGNVSQGMEGIQSAGFINIAQNSAGIQIGGFMNVAQKMTGIQGAGFMNIGQNMTGMQAAGFMNIRKNAKGTQLAGFMNIGENLEGIQAAGFLNIAKKVKGVQVAGFINIADSSDYPIGVINLIGNGEQHLIATVDELGTYSAVFRSGSKKTYGIIGIGINNQRNITERENALLSEVGIGVYLPVKQSFRFRLESRFTSLTNNNREFSENFSTTSIRFFADYNIKRIHFFAGTGIAWVRTNNAAFDHPLIFVSSTSNNINHHLMATAQAGISVRIK